jgi:hypothetical protein
MEDAMIATQLKEEQIYPGISTLKSSNRTILYHPNVPVLTSFVAQTPQNQCPMFTRSLILVPKSLIPKLNTIPRINALLF